MLDRNLLEQSRFHLDNPSLFGFHAHAGEPESQHIESRFLSRYVKVSKSLFPGIALSIQEATKWLLEEREIHAFISSDESLNATCIPGPNDLPIVWLSSGLIKTLNKDELGFVVGHELGHWYYRHYQYPSVDPDCGPKFVAKQQLSRAAEISADRFGLIACRNLDASLRAILKTASGLTDEYLGQGISEFATQARSVDIENIDHWEVFASHPPMVIRARALIWFSMTKQYGEISGTNTEEVSIDTVNNRVEKDLSKVLGREFTQKQTEEIQEAVFWMTVFEITKKGQLSKHDQELILSAFGEEPLKKLKILLGGKSAKEVRDEMRQRAAAAQEVISAYSTVALDEFLEKNTEIAGHTVKFISRFNS